MLHSNEILECFDDGLSAVLSIVSARHYTTKLIEVNFSIV